MQADIAYYTALDARMVNAVSGIHLLELSSWPQSLQALFLESVARGVPHLPQVIYPRLDFSDARRELAMIAHQADPEHPLGRYLCDSIRSFDMAAALLESLGTSAASDYSVQLFGVPEDTIPGTCSMTCEVARHFIQIAQNLDHAPQLPEDQVSATVMCLQLQTDLDAFFEGRVIEVKLNPDMPAKAMASARHIWLRSSAVFSDYDRAQLFHHEALVHSLTALNGHLQPVLPSLGVSSPRTIATQEGLATFAEQITGSIDIERLKRISLRVEAIAMARAGADFIEVFNYFHQSGQDETESFLLAQRVFRGVPLGGGVAFTKDTVYLRGLMTVHHFFCQSLQQDQLRRCRWLFAGKMALEDIAVFAPLFEDGTLIAPRWLPPWVSRGNGLAGMLAFSLLTNRIHVDQLNRWPNANNVVV
ncbi:MAG TPA: flavohemoglobin expression-modulating QEGLA motif protein [Xylella taiwanensis]